MLKVKNVLKLEHDKLLNDCYVLVQVCLAIRPIRYMNVGTTVWLNNYVPKSDFINFRFLLITYLLTSEYF